MQIKREKEYLIQVAISLSTLVFYAQIEIGQYVPSYLVKAKIGRPSCLSKSTLLGIILKTSFGEISKLSP